MRVGLNLIYLVPGRTGGMETVARELIPALASARPDVQLTAFVNRETASETGAWRDATDWVVVPVHATNRLEWVRAEQALLPRMAASAGLDLVHSLGGTAPFWGRFRRVVTIHDFNYRLLPESHGPIYGRGLDVLVRIGTRRADRVIAISESTKREAMRTLSISARRIDVVPNGMGANSDAPPTPEAELRERLNLGERRVLLTLSDKRPHKNLLRLLDAFVQLDPWDWPVLIIAGYSTPYERVLNEHIAELGLESHVRIMSWVSDSDREGLYRLASAFVFPSLYEGFGLPVLEAMARGVPVACSNVASLPEVAGDAALTFAPERTDEIAAALRRLLADDALVGRLREQGRARAASFTWGRAAAGTIGTYERALGIHASGSGSAVA